MPQLGTLDPVEEAGTAPGDRRFRPDVEGLRAVAVVLVVLYHAGVPRLTGGFVGVDVFFVISGFVITGLLLRERSASGRTSILDFYARRVRRILPAAILVILTTVGFSFLFLGNVGGSSTADAGRWADVFLANVHFESLGTNYFTASLPPSPLQNYWSLSVEEQFYVVFPTLFLVVAGFIRWGSTRARLTVTLGAVVVASFWLSVVQTASEPSAAYFSPFTRAWELALGGLIAVSTPWLAQVPGRIAAVLTWVGIAAVAVAACTYGPQTPYPGARVALPVLGAGLIIAGGTAVPSLGLESVLRLGPFQWLGRRSYSLYLWHWPILILAAERVGKTSLPLGQSLLLVLLALVLSAITYALVENPIRHWRLPSRTSVAAGIVLVAVTALLLSVIIAVAGSGSSTAPSAPSASTKAIVDQVTAAAGITRLPKDLTPSLVRATDDWGGTVNGVTCQSNVDQSDEDLSHCTFGDPNGSHLMVAYGDSHAIMWIPALNYVAKKLHWKLVVLGKPYCPAGVVTPVNPPGWQQPNGPYLLCDQWHQWAIKEINTLKPSLLIASQISPYQAPSAPGAREAHISVVQWGRGLRTFLQDVHVRGMKKVILGDIPRMPTPPPACLSQHSTDVQACSIPVTGSSGAKNNPYNDIEELAALVTGTSYVDTTPWFCSTVCTSVVGRYVVYMDRFHVTATYVTHLERVMEEALRPST